MSFARVMATFEIMGPFGRRIVGVAGGRGMVTDTDEFLQRLAAVDQAMGTMSQVFDALRIAGAEHLVRAARSALTAHATNNSFASSLGIELMCWTAAERQIRRAFEKVGVRQGAGELAFLVVGTSRAKVKTAMAEIFHEFAVERDDNVLELRRDKLPIIRRTFSISPEELKVAPFEKLILERVALLTLAR
jgi:tRNA threonylcarbamoyladenosine modification (KEOPS) complex Cgi121 subunit